MDLTQNVTRLLAAVEAGRSGAQEELYRVLHAELRRLADLQMRSERSDHTLQPTAVMHEAWLRLFGTGGQIPHFEGRSHFLRVASAAMRRVLIDHARKHLSLKRGQGARPRSLEDLIAVETPSKPEEVLAVHEALEQLESLDPEQAEVVQLRYFGGLEVPEVAEVMGLSERTVKRRWSFAKAWLYRAIRGENEEPPASAD